jgi:hypothetical protein
MLTKKNWFTLTIGIIFILLQLWLLFKLQLFGDESFYWLEGQHLDLSYAELPGWTAWMIRLGTETFGTNYFAVRIFSYLSFLSLFYAVHLISRHLKFRPNIIVLFSLPLLVLVAVMALPDIWLVFFVVWISYFLFIALKFNRTAHWLLLGVFIAFAINVHVRMWIWLFFAGFSFLFYFYKHKDLLRPAITVTLPIAVLGIIPILIFNQHNDYALFTFQFGRRHPWAFQISNLSFLISQLIVITPLVLVLWFKCILLLKKQKIHIKWLLLTAFMHWLFYVVMSLFADGLRTTIHWGLISYVPVIIISPFLIKNTKLLNTAIFTGGGVSLVLLILLSTIKGESTNIQARLLDNSLGWHELATNIKRIQQQEGVRNIVADYFMTASELAFELKQTNNIKVLPHEKSIKHGRQKQLEIMDFLLQNPTNYKQLALLVVEASTLKLKNAGKYYTQLCQYFNGVSLLETINITQANKQFHVFKVNQGEGCEIPALFYTDHTISNNIITISGWAILHEYGIKSIFIVNDKSEYAVNLMTLANSGIARQFPQIKDPNLPNTGFTFSIPLDKFRSKHYQIKAIGTNDKIYISQIFFLE